MTAANRRVLIVDDNRAIHDDFRKILQAAPASEVDDLEAQLFGATRAPTVAFDLTSAYQGADGVDAVRAAIAAGRPFALAIVDMRMPPGIDGLQTIAGMWELDPSLQIVICTAYSDASWHDVVQRFGPTDRLLILKKPFDLAEVCQLALALTEKWVLADQARARTAELVRSRAELAASLALARAVEEATTDGLLVVGVDQQISVVNRAFHAIWRTPPELAAGHDDGPLVAALRDQLVDPGWLDERIAYFAAHPDASGAGELRLSDDRVLELWTGPVRGDDGQHHGRLWWFRDVTERRRGELERAAATERLAAMGQLAAGVGHEINNPLTYAMANLDSLLDAHARGADLVDLADRLREARDGLIRIRTIVRDLQSVARADDAHREVELREVIEQAIQIAGGELRHRAPIVRRYAPAPPVLGNATRLGQVFLNLLINAAHAIPDGQAAHHRIEVAIRATEHASVVEITDTGSGIAPDHLARIFEPFFTTKAIGAGTGLGLAISRQIVTSHGGTLTARSSVGAGTTMTVTLPHAPVGAKPSAAPAAPAPAPATRRGKVLVIDDEPLITRVLQKSLVHHDVTVASAARDALDRIASGETFDVILCDLMMPDISGIDVHEYLVREHPAIASRVVFMTGGAFTAKAKQFLSTISNARIDKPFSLAQVIQLVDRQVAAPAAS
jgi:signal transduction histidine kinase/DNA-binding NarL/FixJ family response regulator